MVVSDERRRAGAREGFGRDFQLPPFQLPVFPIVTLEFSPATPARCLTLGLYQGTRILVPTATSSSSLTASATSSPPPDVAHLIAGTTMELSVLFATKYWTKSKHCNERVPTFFNTPLTVPASAIVSMLDISNTRPFMMIGALIWDYGRGSQDKHQVFKVMPMRYRAFSMFDGKPEDMTTTSLIVLAMLSA